MPIYKKAGDRLIPIKEKRVGLERPIQTAVEKNLNDVFGLSFVSSEFALNNLRMDTLAFDEENKSFVIIEFKKDRNFSVIDQGFAYLALLLNNKASFVLEYNKRCSKKFGIDNIDWSQSKVVFVAPFFTKYQQEAIGFRDLPIELWEVKNYDQDILAFNQVRASERDENIRVITKNRDAERVSREVKQYTVDDHLRPHWKKAKELFDDFSQRVLELDARSEIHSVKNYIGFNINNKNVVAVKVGESKLLLELLRVRPQDLKDPEKRTRYKKRSFEFYHKHITLFDIKNEDDIDYALALVKQVYKKFAE